MRKFLTILLLAVSTLVGAQGTELITDGDFSSATNWTTGASWSIYGGAAHYDATLLENPLSQAQGDMVGAGIQASTYYTLSFDITAATVPGGDPGAVARMEIESTSGEEYFSVNSYLGRDHILTFTTPSDIGDGGIVFKATIYVSDTFYIDDISLKANAIAGDDPYYVATDGDDITGDGSIENPWKTFYKAVRFAEAGDTIYFRGGIYYSTRQNVIAHSGTYGNDICFFNYPGESPILDCVQHGDYLQANVSGNVYNWGIYANRKEHIHIKGIEVRHVLQHSVEEDNYYLENQGAIHGEMCANFTYENVTVHSIGQKAYHVRSGAYNSWDNNGIDNAPFDYDTTRWINCDVYDLCDSLSWWLNGEDTINSAGNHGDGWKIENWQGTVYKWDGCRAWNYSDDAYDANHAGYKYWNNCWAMSTQKYIDFPGHEFNGWKTTAILADHIYLDSLVNRTDTIFQVFSKCLSLFSNTAFAQDLYLSYGPSYVSVNPVYYNCTAYKNTANFMKIVDATDSNPATSALWVNCIGWGATTSNPCGAPNDVLIREEHIFRTLNNMFEYEYDIGGCGRWVYTTDPEMSDADLLTTDQPTITAAFIAPRRADGSLPAFPLQLDPSSDLIDAGHIGAVDSLANFGITLTYSGLAPDIGAFEYIGYVEYQTALVVAGLNFYSVTDSLNTNFTRIYENIEAVAVDLEGLTSESIPDYTEETMDSIYVGIDRGSAILTKFNTNSTETYANVLAIGAEAEILYGGPIPGYTEHTADVMTANSTTGVTFHIILNRNPNELFEMIQAIVAALDTL